MNLGDRNIKYSIIVPVFNTDKYLSQCLDSICRQQFKEYEAILIDDGSTDESPAICDRYAEMDNRFKVIHKENGGVTSARKVGVQIASGDYITCVDSDDWISPTYLSNNYELIEMYDPDMIVSGWISANHKSTSVNNVRGFDKGMYKRESIKGKIFPTLIENGGGGTAFRVL